jgi:caffeoyl-CoA O-methyltransferase
MVPRAPTAAKKGSSGSGGVIDANFDDSTPQPQPQSQQPQQHALLGSSDLLLDALSSYSERHSEPEPAYLEALRIETEARFGPHARMISGHLQGRLLSLLTQLSGAGTVLELGAFTGYSALCFAEGLSSSSSSSSSSSALRRKVLSCEIDPEALEIARRHVASAPAGLAALIDLREVRASDLLAAARLEGLRFDVVFIDADKKQYETYLLDLLGEGQGQGQGQGQGCLLNEGAIILVDNTLWKGLVLHSERQGQGQGEAEGWAPQAAAFGNERRMQALADSMHAFNARVRGHHKLRPLVLPLRDGLSIIRYSSA